jgi:hypothetical protein
MYLKHTLLNQILVQIAPLRIHGRGQRHLPFADPMFPLSSLYPPRYLQDKWLKYTDYFRYSGQETSLFSIGNQDFSSPSMI